MYDGTILQELQRATMVAVGISSTPTLPVKYTDVDFTPPDDQKWLEIVFIPNNPPDDYWGDEQNYMGMFRLILHWPNDQRGAYGPMAVLASICSYFSKSLALQTVKISDKPKAMAPVENGTENLFPASIRYQCFRLA